MTKRLSGESAEGKDKPVAGRDGSGRSRRQVGPGLAGANTPGIAEHSMTWAGLSKNVRRMTYIF